MTADVERPFLEGLITGAVIQAHAFAFVFDPQVTMGFMAFAGSLGRSAHVSSPFFRT